MQKASKIVVDTFWRYHIFNLSSTKSHRKIAVTTVAASGLATNPLQNSQGFSLRRPHFWGYPQNRRKLATTTAASRHSHAISRPQRGTLSFWHFPDLPFLVFFDFLVFFRCKDLPCFFEHFPFFIRVLGVQQSEQILAFWVVLLAFPKR